MRFKINYDEIFFDRYPLSFEEKRDYACYLLTKALDEKNCTYTIEDNIIDLREDYNSENVIGVLKRQFFILLEEEIERVIVKKVAEEEIELYIRKMYVYETFSVDQICDEFGIKRGALDNLFVKKYQMTVKEYLKHLRVSKAKELIEEGNKVYHVASLCGFGSTKTMQRAFKDVYNTTPGAFAGHLTEKL